MCNPISPSEKQKPRIETINWLRIICALCVIGKTSTAQLGTHFYTFSRVVWSAPSMMTLFFMISGFVVAYNYQKVDLNTGDFYRRRAIGLLPGYWSFILLASFYDIARLMLACQDEVASYLRKLAWMLPVDIVGLQSAIPYQSFTFSHNGGTWFLSCLFFCMLAYPPMQRALRQISVKTRIMLLIANIAVINLIVYFHDELGISWPYTFIPFRILNFSIGVLAAGIPGTVIAKLKLDKTYAMWGVAAVLILALSLMGKANVELTIRGTIATPLFLLLLLSVANLPAGRITKSRAVTYLGELAFMIFLCEYFCWDFLKWIFRHETVGSLNWLKIVLSGVTVIAVASLVHELIEKPLKRIMRQKVLKPKKDRTRCDTGLCQ